MRVLDLKKECLYCYKYLDDKYVLHKGLKFCPATPYNDSECKMFAIRRGLKVNDDMSLCNCVKCDNCRNTLPTDYQSHKNFKFCSDTCRKEFKSLHQDHDIDPSKCTCTSNCTEICKPSDMIDALYLQARDNNVFIIGDASIFCKTNRQILTKYFSSEYHTITYISNIRELVYGPINDLNGRIIDTDENTNKLENKLKKIKGNLNDKYEALNEKIDGISYDDEIDNIKLDIQSLNDKMDDVLVRIDEFKNMIDDFMSMFKNSG